MSTVTPIDQMGPKRRTAMRAAALKLGQGIRWYLKQATGEAKWDEYLERCRREDTEPMSRRDFERHRAEHKENHPQSRCC